MKAVALTVLALTLTGCSMLPGVDPLDQQTCASLLVAVDLVCPAGEVAAMARSASEAELCGTVALIDKSGGSKFVPVEGIRADQHPSQPGWTVVSPATGKPFTTRYPVGEVQARIEAARCRP